MSDTSIKSGIVKYTSRDYQSILQDFINAIPTLTELWDGESDSDPGVILAKFIASAADMLSINLDIQANEVYAPTVSQRKNAEKIFSLFGYNLGYYTAGKTEITFTNASSEEFKIDFGFNGSNFCTLNAYTDITNTERVITYNILPITSAYTDTQTRSTRNVISDGSDVIVDTEVSM